MAVIQRHYPLDQVSDERVRQAITILSTEQGNLQTARAATISEAIGRLSSFLGTISGVLIALGFAGQAASFGTPFRVLALVLLPSLLLVGIATCGRVLQTSLEDIHYHRGISRIRHFYVEAAPELADYLMGSIHDDMVSGMRGMGTRWSRWQPFLSSVALISMVNSIIAGMLVALIVIWAAQGSIPTAVVVGLVVGLGAFGAHVALGMRVLRESGRETPPLFPAR
jgi:hypothetical protein